MMKYVFILAFFAVTLFASIQTSGIGFDYDNATTQERVEWLDTQVSITNTSFKKALRAKYGYSSAIKILSMEPSMGRSIQAVLTLDYADARRNAGKLKTELKAVFCPRYAKLPIADHDLTVLFTMKDIDLRRVGRFSITHNDCKRYLDKSAIS